MSTEVTAKQNKSDEASTSNVFKAQRSELSEEARAELSHTLSEPISRPLYTCTESALIISPSRRLASSSPSFVLPTAVGPVIMIILGRPGGLDCQVLADVEL